MRNIHSYIHTYIHSWILFAGSREGNIHTDHVHWFRGCFRDTCTHIYLYIHIHTFLNWCACSREGNIGTDHVHWFRGYSRDTCMHAYIHSYIQREKKGEIILFITSRKTSVPSLMTWHTYKTYKTYTHSCVQAHEKGISVPTMFIGSEEFQGYATLAEGTQRLIKKCPQSVVKVVPK